MRRRDVLKALGGLTLCPTGVFGQEAATNFIERGIQSLQERAKAGQAALTRLQTLRAAVLANGDRAALAELQTLANQQNTSAMLFLGCVFEQGLGGVRKDEYSGAKYFHAAAKLNDTIALYNLGLIYFYGRSIRRDPVTAEKYFHMASHARVKHAHVVLGALYEERSDWPNAARTYLFASGHRMHDEATFKHGLFALKGLGLSRSVRDAVLVLERACETWHPGAMMSLMEIQVNGLAGQVNYGAAMKWSLILQHNTRRYDKKVAAAIIPRGVLNDVELASVTRSADLWMTAHPMPTVVTDYSRTIWED